MISNLCALQFDTTPDFEANLQKLITLVESCPKDSIIVAPELCLSGYSYEHMQKAAEFSQHAKKEIKAHSQNKTIILTMIVQDGDHFYNTAFVFHNNHTIHKQSKHELFVLNDERKFFTSGKESKIKIFEVNGIKIAILICFELRFIDLWKKIQGADIIAIPAMWGSLRKDHFESLTKSLAIINQCFVIASDSANEDCAKGSGIITPFGIENRDDKKERIIQSFDIKEIKKMRRYMDVGLK
ncbi:carbon-nitrogen hydrolase family protein [Arcobacter sp. FWKO B]|uniref:carbon-nitrogen hydrolase family protein n=1 Tax=Arcobacter sp. FWKO B TaxID=2593672 RepID=UPI0018A4E545|nr:carbon-nitrogen hydrolase family protein [Arcobacter sp. FWKO B]QOG12331.1 carbon-nitrogen hydrolase family protein [Arcobacter sp. FWKO B]